MTTTSKTRKWQAKFRNWIGGSKYGVMCVGVRRNGRGDWKRPIDAPEEVRDFLYLKQSPGAGHWCCEDFKTLDEFTGGAENAKCRITSGGLIVNFEVDEKIDPRPVPCHGMIRELCREIGCDSLGKIYRYAYKGSSCGVGVGFLVAKDGWAEWIYCDSLNKLPSVSELLASGAEVVACSVSGYVEGWDGECDTRIIESTRAKRATAKDFWAAIEEADEEADYIWNQTHGCDNCGIEGEYGDRAINPKCKSCNGGGVIL